MNALITGGFGFSGQYLVYGLLQKGYTVVMIGRETETQTVNDRLKLLVENNNHVNSTFSVPKERFKNITVLQGDIAKENFNLSKSDSDYLNSIKIDEIYNLAAFLRYEDSFRDQIMQTNVNGTERLIQLACKNNSRFVHASTVYIAGKQIEESAPIKEMFYDTNKHLNAYLESKSLAESIIRNYGKENGLDYLIFRFPTLIGDSKTGYTNSLFAFYEYLWALSTIRSKVKKNIEIRFNASPKGTVNLVPTDIVIECLLKICCNAHYDNRIFNLTDAHPLNHYALSKQLNKLFDLTIIPNNNENYLLQGTKTEKLFARLTRKNASFAQQQYQFDSSNSEKFLGHPVSKGWEKGDDYFTLLKQGYENHTAKFN